MARIFISHSSRDDEATRQIKGWLDREGFDQLFLDFDKHAGIAPGADWERTLYREISRADAIVLLVTPNWLASKWCFAEFTQARALGKMIFPIIVTPECDDKCIVAQDIQHIDLTAESEGGLERLAKALHELAFETRGGFSWDSTRPPYPGIMCFQEEDAAIFFGRDDDARRIIERLNSRRTQGGTRLIVLLAASGAGKSSLLRAGVLPRLKQDKRNWIVTPPFRPRARPVDELSKSLAVAVRGTIDWAKLRDRLLNEAPADVLQEYAAELQVAQNSNEGQILISIDQAEELFSTAQPDQADRFFDTLSRALSGELPFIAVMAMRADFLGALQEAQQLTTPFEEFSLKPIPLTRIAEIIKGPARIAGLTVEDALLNSATHDAETEDALPLLAFAIRELYERFGSDDCLSLADYNALGDPVAGFTPLENAIRKVADEVLNSSAPTENELEALRRAFIPMLVRVNDEGDYVRQAASWSTLPDGAKRLLESFANARLLIIRREDEVAMVEVAHEALLRKWPKLRSWLDSEREFLVGKQRLAYELFDWKKRNRHPKGLLVGNKLALGLEWLASRPMDLTPDEREFISESRRWNKRQVWINRLPIASMILAALVMLPFSGTIMQFSDGNALIMYERLDYFSLPTWMLLSAATVLGLTMAATYSVSWLLVLYVTKR